MTTQSVSPSSAAAAAYASWLPMIVIAMGQALMSFNVAAIPVSMGGMVASFNTPPTTVGTAIVMYSLGVSGFVMLAAKLGQRFGSKLFFQAAVALFLAAMVTMVISPNATVMLAAQGLAGLAGAALVPTLVALIATHYRGTQQAEAVGWLGLARAIAGVLAFVIVGYVAMINWRLAFGLLIVHAAAILFLSFKLKPAQTRPEVKIDVLGVILAAAGIILIAFGFNNVRNWGMLLARPAAPFNVLGLVTVGLGQGALVTLLFNVLVTASPKELAGDVGSLRGVTQNLAAAVGTAVMGALLVSLLSSMIMTSLVDNPVIPVEFKRAELAQRFDLNNINFIRNEQLKERLQQTTATPEQVDEAVRINTETRLRSLKIGFLVLSGLALLAIFPCSWLPDYRPGEIPSDQPGEVAEQGERQSA